MREETAEAVVAFLLCVKESRRRKGTRSEITAQDLWKLRLKQANADLGPVELEKRVVGQLRILKKELGSTTDPRKIRARFGLSVRGRARLLEEIVANRRQIRRENLTN
jgi:hypothetical protein